MSSPTRGPRTAAVPAPPAVGHVLTVDAARGVLAAAVMAYHVLYAEQLAAVERVAFYAVYAFFAISGFALYVTYRDRLRTAEDHRQYLLRRVLRIAPLYYVALLWTVVQLGPSAEVGYRVLLNLSLLFGFANPGRTSLVGGGWSIGIEMVFYLVLPAVVAVAGGSVRRLAALAAGAAVLSLAHTNHALQGHPTMSTGWVPYTQPAAFFVYFAAGCLAAEVFLRHGHRLKGHWAAAATVVLSLVPFLLVDVAVTNDLLRGRVGVLLMASTVAFVVGVAFLPEPTGRLRTAALWLGRLSYPVYLLHGLVLTQVALFRDDLPRPARIGVVVVVTLVVSWAVHRFLETPARRLAHR